MATTEAENLRHCPTCNSLLTESVLGGQCPSCTIKVLSRIPEGENNPGLPEPGVASAFSARRYLGDYELIAQLGRGGMGVVYRARQLSLNREVAVKLIAPERLNSPKAVERFHAEAEATAHLDHPNIVAIYETGEAEGRHYFSMKLIEGQTLTQQIGDEATLENPRPSRWSAAAALLAKVADAVHYAHQCGILHRDLKPGNILIDQHGEPHITDFGLAKYFDLERNLSFSGEVLGTPAYMAPELAIGKAGRTTTAADVYSLGAILYEVLTGHAPFGGESPMEILEAVLHSEPISPRLLNPAVPRDLETMALRCLEKEPAKRYPSARAIADELRRFVNGEPIQARPITRRERAWRWCRRNPPLAGALAGMALAAIVGLAGVLWQWQRARVNAAESREAELAARANLYAADINLVQQALATDNLRQALDLLQRYIPRNKEPDLRGFEWRYFWQQSRGEELFSLPGHERIANCLAFSPDGTRLATGGFDRRIMVWELSSHQLIATLPHADRVMSVAFSPQGGVLATATKSSVRLWNTSKYVPFRDLPQAAGKLVFSPNGQYLVTTSTNGLTLWNTVAWSVASTWARRGLWQEGSDGVGFGIAFCCDGTRIGLVENDGIHLISVPEFKESTTLKERMPLFRFVVFSPDGRTLAASSTGNDVKLWNFDSGQPIRSLAAHSDSVFSARFSPDGRVLVTCSADQTLKLWNVSDGKLIRTFQGHSDEIWDVVFSPDGKMLASVGKDGGVKMWDLERKPRPEPILQAVRPLGFGTNGTLIAFGTNGRLMTIDAASLQTAEKDFFVPAHLFSSDLGSLFNDGHTAGLMDVSGRAMEIWDLSNQRLLCRLESLDQHVSFSPGKQLLATATSNQTVTVWQLPSGSTRYVLTHSTPPLAFSPEGSMLVTEADPGRSIKVWKLGGTTVGAETITYGSGEHSCSLALSPDARLLAVGTWEGTVCLLKMPSGQQVAAFVGHKRAVSSLCFSPDGRTLASMSNDRTLRLWHVASQREVARFQEPSEDIMFNLALAFSPDGRALAAKRTWAGGEVTRLWFAPSFPEIDAGQTHAIAVIRASQQGTRRP